MDLIRFRMASQSITRRRASTDGDDGDDDVDATVERDGSIHLDSFDDIAVERAMEG